MTSNPEVCRYGGKYAIRFARKDWNVIWWCQGLDSPRMKHEWTGVPIITYPTMVDAEKAARELVIPYLLKEKGVTPEEIKGW